MTETIEARPPLVTRIPTTRVKVNGFGQSKTPEPFVNVCARITNVEGLGEPPPVVLVAVMTGVPQQRLRGAPRNYGYVNSSELIEATRLFGLRRRNLTNHVRAIRRK